jgi:hypothetical protein
MQEFRTASSSVFSGEHAAMISSVCQARGAGNQSTPRREGKPESGKFAVKVINHYGDEVPKVFGV